MGIPPLRRLARVLQIHLRNRLLERKISSSSSSVSLNPVIPTSSGLQFLVEECGLPLKLSSSVAQKMRFDEKLSSNDKSVITFLKSHDFSEAQIAQLIEKHPWILRCRVSTNLNPKFQYLIEKGFKDSHLRHIVLQNPHIFRSSLTSCIKPAHEFLKTFFGSNESTSAVIRRTTMLLTSANLDKKMKINIEYLAKKGMSSSSIVRFTRYRPLTMLLSNNRLVHFVEKVKDLGVKPHSPMFPHVLRARAGMSDSTWKRKVEIFKSLGWSDEDVVSTFVRSPSCFDISEKKLRMAWDFFVNDMGISREVIIACPVVLMYSLKERTWPRCSVVKVLEAEKLLDKWSLSSLINQPEKLFIRNFITKHLDRVPHLLETYQRSKKSGNMS